MAITAHLEAASATAGQPRKPRRKLRLEARGATASGDATNVLVHNISATGLLLECPVSLAIGETIEIDLPLAGASRAQVIWISGNLYGCQFDTPISAAALSAAQLRSPTGQDLDIPPLPESLHDESFGVRLKNLRKARGLTLSQIADSLSVSKPTVWAWEQGKAHPMDSRIEALAHTLGVSRADLLSGSGDESGLRALLTRSREQIARAVGTSPEKIRISIEL